jgi:addiction module HigA family antidote
LRRFIELSPRRGSASPRLRLDQHGARAALCEAAAELRAVQLEVVSKDVEERRVRLDRDRSPLTVDAQRETDHGSPLVPARCEGTAAGRRVQWTGCAGCAGPRMVGRDLRVPVTRMSEIVNRRRSITADTALRLGRYFGTTPEFWMNLQAAYDLDSVQRASADRIARDVNPREAA